MLLPTAKADHITANKNLGFEAVAYFSVHVCRALHRNLKKISSEKLDLIDLNGLCRIYENCFISEESYIGIVGF